MSHGYGYNRPQPYGAVPLLALFPAAILSAAPIFRTKLKNLSKAVEKYELEAMKYSLALKKFQDKFPNDPEKVNKKVKGELKSMDLARAAMIAAAEKARAVGKLPVEMEQRIFGSGPSSVIVPPPPPAIPAPAPTPEFTVESQAVYTDSQASGSNLPLILAGVGGLALIGGLLFMRSRRARSNPDQEMPHNPSAYWVTGCDVCGGRVWLHRSISSPPPHFCCSACRESWVNSSVTDLLPGPARSFDDDGGWDL